MRVSKDQDFPRDPTSPQLSPALLLVVCIDGPAGVCAGVSCGSDAPLQMPLCPVFYLKVKRSSFIQYRRENTAVRSEELF